MRRRSILVLTSRSVRHGPVVAASTAYGGGKRQKERQRAEKKAEKEARRKARQAEKSDPEVPEGVDPDIADITPGPQPRSDD